MRSMRVTRHERNDPATGAIYGTLEADPTNLTPGSGASTVTARIRVETDPPATYGVRAHGDQALALLEAAAGDEIAAIGSFHDDDDEPILAAELIVPGGPA